ncbi:MAG TPA: ATP-binding protein [Flavitalea sp.]|nr:ATP-binding protein [Flavitalea sp.]
MLPFRRAVSLSIAILIFIQSSNAQTAWLDSLRMDLSRQREDTSTINTLLILSWSFQSCYPDSGVAYALKALALSEKINNDELLFASQSALNASLDYTGDYPMQLDNTFRALSLAKKLNTPYSDGYSTSLLSEFYYNIGQYDSSMIYGRKVAWAISVHDPEIVPMAWVLLAKLFAATGHPDSAVFYSRKALQHLPDTRKKAGSDNEFQSLYSFSYPIIGNAFFSDRKYDSALYYYRLGEIKSEPIQHFPDMMDDYTGISEVFHALGRDDSAIYYSSKVLHNYTLVAYPAAKLKAATILATIYESRNATDSALKYLHVATGLKDSLFSRDKMIAIQQTAFNERQKQQGLASSQAAWQNHIRTFGIIFTIVVLLAIVVIIVAQRRKKQLMAMRNKIADDLHDDIGSTLSSISIMNELAKAKSPEALPLLTTIGESTLTLQENMSDIVWTVNPGNDSMNSVIERMNEFANSILESRNISLDFDSVASVSSARLSMTQRKNLYLFFKEAINNAAKYSNARLVNVLVTKRDHLISMTIIDDGEGFDPGRIVAGNGMASFKRRATELNGTAEINSIPGKGTIVKLEFKIT